MKQYAICEYARGELSRLWAAAGGPDYSFELVTDENLAPYSFGYEGCATCKKVRIIGRGERELVPAVYHALEAVGFYFDTETHLPTGDRFTPEAILKRDIVTPFVGLRGIRQHINFPMDISSYTKEGAQDYIRMLARMGMNAITFHSYDGMWHRNPGGFFYDKPHRIDTHPVLAEFVHNERYYISPACEKDFDDRPARGRFAIDFLRGLMDTAKECGMHVTLSVEPAEDAAVTLEALSFYPQIDMLELITPEGGGTAPEAILDGAGLAAKAALLFGEAALDGGSLAGLYEKDEHSPRIYPSMLSLRRAMDQLPHIKDVPVRVGLYITDPETLCVIKGIMDRVLPKDMIFTYLAAHGTDAVVTNLSQKNMLRPEDFSRTVIHAWSEFDGNMYILQNAANAEARLLSYAQRASGAEQIYAMYFNHWRTAENNFAIAAAGAFTKKPADVRDFYKRYAEAFDLCPDGFAELMYRLGELDVYCRDKLFNIGFCYRGCWVSAGLNWMKYKTCDRIEAAIAEFNEIREALLPFLDAARAKGSDALALLTLLENRIRVSIAHLHMTHAIRKIEEEMPPEQIKECLDRSRRYAEEYLRLHAECMPERASEGTLASYFDCMFGYLDALGAKYLANLTVNADHDKSVIDAPAVVDAPAQA